MAGTLEDGAATAVPKALCEVIFCGQKFNLLLDLPEQIRIAEGAEVKGVSAGASKITCDNGQADRAFKWTDPAIRTLLSLVDEKKAFRQCKSGEKRRLWQGISETLNAEGYNVPSWESVSKKWANLFDTYKRILERHKTGAVRTTWEYFETFEGMFSGTDIIKPNSRIVFPAQTAVETPAAESHKRSDSSCSHASMHIDVTPESNPLQIDGTPESNPLHIDVTQESNPSSNDESNYDTSSSIIIDSGSIAERVVLKRNNRKRKQMKDHENETCYNVTPPVWFQEYLQRREENDKKWREEVKKLMLEKNNALAKLTDAITVIANSLQSQKQKE